MGNSMNSYCGGPGFWGPTSRAEDRSIDPNWDYDADLSTCFEDTVITSIPSAFIIIFGLARAFFIRHKRDVQPSQSNLYAWKQLLAFFLLLLLVADCCVAIYDGMVTYRVVSPAVMAIGMATALIVLLVEHRAGVRSSSVLTVFWLLSLVADCVRLRTFILHADHGQTNWLHFGVFIPHLALDLISFVLTWFKEPPGYSLLQEDLKPCPENTAHFFSIITFWWMSGLIRRGYKQALTEDDLFNLNREDQTQQLAHTFRKKWANELKKGQKKASVVRALAKSFGATFALAAIFKVVQDTLSFLSPQLLKYILRFAQDLDAPKWKGVALAVLMFIAAVIQSLCLHQYFHRVMKTGMRLRSAIINIVYRKSLVLSSEARQSITSGEVVNLMAVDAQRFMDLMSYFHMLWSAPYQICLALYFLWDLVGPSALAGLAVMICMIPVNGVIAAKRRTFQKQQMEQKDHRVRLMNEVLGGIKVLKLYGWETPFANFIRDIRSKELKILLRGQYLNSIGIFTWTAAPFLVSLVTFIVYTLTGHPLTAEKAFVALSLFNLLRFPLAMLPMMITAMVEASVSLNRLRRYLLLEERDLNNVIKDERTMASFANDGKGDSSFKDGQLPAVLVQDGEFSWKKGQPILKNINVRLPPASLTAIVGRVGSGKSSVVSALLGDMVKEKGTVIMPGSVAYVPQQAWMRTASLRDNITFGRPFDSRKYREVLRACALEPDLETLPGGDMAEIGEKGINLSGGQKQRVALARAVYQNADIYIMDDPLSAVDSHVGHHIFDNVVGPGGLLRNKVRILVTHGLQYLPKVNKILALQDGCICEQGTYEELKAARGDFAAFLDEYSNEKELDADSQESEKHEHEGDHFEQSHMKTERSASTLSVRSRRGTHRDDGKASEKTQLISKETSAEGSVSWNIYKEYLRAVGYGTTAFLVFMIVASYAFQIGSTYWLQYWSDQETPMIGNRSNNSLPGMSIMDRTMNLFADNEKDDKLPLYLGVYAALGFGNSIGWGLTALVLAVGSLHASRTLHNNMLYRVMRSPMSFFDTTPLGRIVNRFTKDMYVIDDTIPMSLRSFLNTFMQVFSTVLVISITTPVFLAAVVPIGVFYYFVQRYYVATSRQLKRLESVARSPIYAHFSETLAGVSSIRAYERTQSFIAENEQKLDRNLEAYYPSVSANRWLAIRLEFVGNLVIFFSALFAVLDREHLSPGKIGLSLSYAMSVTQVLNWMVRMSSQLETDIVAVERVEEYTHLETEAPPVMPHRPSLKWPENGVVKFDKYSVRYREGLDLVLRDINAEIKPAEKIGIVGRTGAGKSSLTLCLFRILEPATGTIIVDGEDITKIGLDDLRSRLTIMPQDPVLFSGTVRRNLDPFDRYSDEQLWRALDTCHLKKVVESLEGGLEHEVAEGGENFSIGQRQLMCLARAVLRKTKVLVLDEATAAVDFETDDLLQKTIRTEFKDCTIFTIAHRLNTILDSDRIMVLDKGRIVEFDTPSSLLATPTSVFYGMAKAANLV